MNACLRKSSAYLIPVFLGSLVLLSVAFGHAPASNNSFLQCLDEVALKAQAQAGGFMYLSSTADGSSRGLMDTPGLHYVYVLHFSTGESNGFTGSRFRINNNGFTGTWVADVSPYMTVGNSQAGISIAYGGCYDSPGLILSMMYSCTGTSGCETISLVPDPGASTGNVEAVDCNQNVFLASTGDLCVNGDILACDGSCHCTVPAEQSTWGKIKAIYSE